MDFSWSEEQREFRQAVLRFARRDLADDVIVRDRNSEFSWEGWKRCAAFGIHGLPIPEAYGGSAADVLKVVLAMEALGEGCRDSGLLFSINAHMWSAEIPILHFGSETQRKTYLPRLCSGEWVGVHGVTEPDSGSDAFSMRTSAVRRGDRYILNGTKMFITNAPIADLIIVFATINPKMGMAGITAFLVEKGTRGLSISRKLEKMGLRTSPMAELILEDCEVPEENVLGEEGSGAAIFNTSMEWERSCILAAQVGMMERQLAECVAYARKRKQFGRSIGRFQLVASKIADMKVRLETSRLLLYRVACQKGSGRPSMLDAAMAKLHISDCAVQSSLDAIQIHGGYGYMTETEVERDLRDAVAGRIYSGTSEIQRLLIAGAMGLGPTT